MSDYFPPSHYTTLPLCNSWTSMIPLAITSVVTIDTHLTISNNMSTIFFLSALLSCICPQTPLPPSNHESPLPLLLYFPDLFPSPSVLTTSRSDQNHEGEGDQAHSHGPRSCRSHDRMAKLGNADGGRGGHPSVPNHHPGTGKGAAAGERRLQ